MQFNECISDCTVAADASGILTLAKRLSQDVICFAAPVGSGKATADKYYQASWNVKQFNNYFNICIVILLHYTGLHSEMWQRRYGSQKPSQIRSIMLNGFNQGETLLISYTHM